jgi:hypothetical protein
MLLALAKKLRADVAKTATDLAPTALPIGSLTLIELYQTPRYGEVDGNLVRIEGEGNMVGFSPVTKCVDAHGETAWIPTELVKNISLEPFTFVTAGTTRGKRASPPATK